MTNDIFRGVLVSPTPITLTSDQREISKASIKHIAVFQRLT